MTGPNALTQSMSMEAFWSWLNGHYNCILRAGGLGFELFDQDDIHWHLGVDPDGTYVVQLIRGKEATAEFFFNPADVLYVQSSPAEEEQILFECVGGDPAQPTAICHFLMSHGLEEADAPPARTWTH